MFNEGEARIVGQSSLRMDPSLPEDEARRILDDVAGRGWEAEFAGLEDGWNIYTLKRIDD